MSDEDPDAADRAFDAHEAFTSAADGYDVTTTVFEASVTATGGAGSQPTYRVRVTVPSIEAATHDQVGAAVVDGWFETFERRLADAPQATRSAVTLDRLTVTRDGADVVVDLWFSWPDPAGAVDIAKTLVEYVEGTYVEGVIPGYDYRPPVTDLLSRAETGGDATSGGTPL